MPAMPSRGGNRPGLREVAALAGVGISTVSRVIRNAPDVSTDTRERVNAAIAQLGYSPNPLGQMLRHGVSYTVACVVSDISNPLFSEIALGASEALADKGYSLLLTNSMRDLAREVATIETLTKRQVDGMLISTISETSQDLLEALDRFPGPIVALDRDVKRDNQIDYVWSDHGAGISAAMDHLHRLGHRHVLLEVAYSHLRPARQRRDAACAAAERLGMRCDVVSVDTVGSDEAPTIGSAMRSADPPTAIITGNNQYLEGTITALHDLGLDFPRDVSLITSDEIPLQRAFNPSIAAIARDSVQLGATAGRLMLERLEGEPDRPMQTVVLPVTYRPGGSVGEPPVRAPQSPGK